MPSRKIHQNNTIHTHGTTARFAAFESISNRSTCGKVAAAISLIGVGIVSAALGNVLHGIVVTDSMTASTSLAVFWGVTGLSIAVVLAFIVTNFGMNSAKVSSTLRISGIMVCALAGTTFLQTTWKSTLRPAIDGSIVDQIANVMMTELHYRIHIIMAPAPGVNNISLLQENPYDLIITILAAQLTLFTYQFTGMVQMIHVMTIENLSSIRSGVCLIMSVFVTAGLIAEIILLGFTWDNPTDEMVKWVIITLWLTTGFGAFQVVCVVIWLKFAKSGWLEALQSSHTVIAGVVLGTLAVSSFYASLAHSGRSEIWTNVLEHQCYLIGDPNCFTYMAYVRAIKYRRMTEVFVVLLITIHTVEYFQTGISMINKTTSDKQVAKSKRTMIKH